MRRTWCCVRACSPVLLWAPWTEMHLAVRARRPTRASALEAGMLDGLGAFSETLHFCKKFRKLIITYRSRKVQFVFPLLIA